MVTPPEQRILDALAEREWVREFVQVARGDPRLTAYEEQFVSDMWFFVERQGRYAGASDKLRLSSKQIEFVRRLWGKTETEPEDHEDADFEC